MTGANPARAMQLCADRPRDGPPSREHAYDTRASDKTISFKIALMRSGATTTW